MKNNKLLLAFALVIINTAAIAQNKLSVNANIKLPKDSVLANTLINALDSFLAAAQKPNEENIFILPAQKLETFIQLDEVYGIENNRKLKDTLFYKPYLTNVVAIENNNYLVQVAYIGLLEETPILRANFEFIAHKKNNSFLFSSPLIRNTKNWKIKKAGNNIFHYKTTINEQKVAAFEKLASTFDKKLKVVNKECVFYLTSDFVSLQKLIGVNYKLDYNGITENNLSSTLGNNNLIILGCNSATFDNFDTHDLFHDRLSLVISRRKVNKPIDEGCAYL